MSIRKLKIAVPRSVGFPELVNVDRNLQSNVTSATGFCIDVFKAAIEEAELELELEVDYEFIPFLNATGENIGTHSELIDEVYLEFANALSRGSKNGGVSSIIDEIPYIKIFLAKYSADYAMIGSTSTTNGFAFAFRKGSPLVPYMSRAIAKLRENGKLMKLEHEWFKRQSTFASEDDDPSSVVKPLTLNSFRGLFLISGVSSALALAVLYGFKLYKNWHFVKNFSLRDIMWGRIKLDPLLTQMALLLAIEGLRENGKLMKMERMVIPGAIEGSPSLKEEIPYIVRQMLRITTSPPAAKDPAAPAYSVFLNGPALTNGPTRRNPWANPTSIPLRSGLAAVR
ncbi:hypothetical protein Pint_03116 [Pistacia integerrima]|uniref:Uncharacterized protein n=1 Tax=Pistacia integerrima TaxID=434235 RepID=A0ACC0ZI20_9ROSI|nr:hypothetical protein Pint_03116 [Pistacia integerrima]